MSTSDQTSDAGVDVRQSGAVAIVEIQRPPHNFFDFELIEGIADRLEAIDADDGCRAVVLCAQGKSFCAGADFSKGRRAPAARSPNATNPLYLEAIRIFSCRKPIVVAVQGPAIGGGLGLALVGDFRVTCPEGRFSANFNRLGFHPGFGLSVTLPRLVGAQQAALMLYTGRRLNGDEAVRIGLADELVPQADLRARALALAGEIAESAPLAVQSTRATLRAGLVDALRVAVARESREQALHYRTEDFKEGIAAAAERRQANFKGR
jgi:enoyl-CoA hydratase/carnithine racemase